ncbi:MAG: hypothetical protein R3F56_06785 [Planctomycetota bacterium]
MAQPRMEECAHCGHLFRAGRPACPECGSDASTGWKSSDDIDYLSVELPDDAPLAPSANATHLWWWLAMVAAVVAALVFAL